MQLMCEVTTIEDYLSFEFEDQFFRDILDHWIEIKDDNSLPLTTNFRPQKFSGNITRLALFVQDEMRESAYARVIGSTVIEMFRVPETNLDISLITDEAIRIHYKNLVRKSLTFTEPTIIETTVRPDTFFDFSCTVLCLPFYHGRTANKDKNTIASLHAYLYHKEASA